MNLHINKRLLSMALFKNLDVLVKSYFSKDLSGDYVWNPATLNDINKTDLFYEPITKFFRLYNTELPEEYRFDDVDVNYIKNYLYFSKGKSIVLDNINDLLSNAITTRPSGLTPITFEYDYDFPELFIHILTLPSQLHPLVMINSLTEMVYYLLFFDEDTFRILIENINILINEAIIEYSIRHNMEYKVYTNVAYDELPIYEPEVIPDEDEEVTEGTEGTEDTEGNDSEVTNDTDDTNNSEVTEESEIEHSEE